MHIEAILPPESRVHSSVLHAKENSLSLSIESSTLGDAIVLHCKGRIVFGEEVVKLSRVVGESIEATDLVILDLKGVSAIDSAGLGEMVALHMWARGHGCTLKMTGLSSRIRHLLEVTNLTAVFEICATEQDAIGAIA
jgi:anti-sigma B factor antagonist